MLCILPYSCLFVCLFVCFTPNIVDLTISPIHKTCRRIARLFVAVVIVHMHVQAACAFLTFHQLFHLHLKSNKSPVLKQ